MKALFVAAAATFAVGAFGTLPARAEGCGSMQQSAAQPADADMAKTAGGAMCGAAGAAEAAPVPHPPKAGGCSCCQKMAMAMPEMGGTAPKPQADAPAAPAK